MAQGRLILVFNLAWTLLSSLPCMVLKTMDFTIPEGHRHNKFPYLCALQRGKSYERGE
jgi:hypothetical protein